MSRGRKACEDRLAEQKNNMASSKSTDFTDRQTEKHILKEDYIPRSIIPRKNTDIP